MGCHSICSTSYLSILQGANFLRTRSIFHDSGPRKHALRSTSANSVTPGTARARHDPAADRNHSDIAIGVNFTAIVVVGLSRVNASAGGSEI
jgi:hypothetical protein